ncbi:MAG: amidohydrolase family protein [Planctomycetota bacterium]
MATLNPARLLGIDDRFGGVETAKEASLMVFRRDGESGRIEVLATLVRGEVAWRAR